MEKVGDIAKQILDNLKKKKMKEYKVKFEFFGRKMQTKIMAQSEADAMLKIAQKIKIHSCEEIEGNNFDRINRFFKDFK